MAETKSSGDKPTSMEPMVSDEFLKFLITLAVDPAKLGAFIKDPDATMKAAGISDVDRAILKSGHPMTIHARLSGQRFTLTPDATDLSRAPGAQDPAQSAVYASSGHVPQPPSWNTAVFPSPPYQTYPQVYHQVHPQVYPQVYHQVHPQVYPQVYHQVHPQVYPQVYHQVHPQVYHQVHPQVHHQAQPQVHPYMPGVMPIPPSGTGR